MTVPHSDRDRSGDPFALPFWPPGHRHAIDTQREDRRMTPESTPSRPVLDCIVDGCERPSVARKSAGLCNMHRDRIKRLGSTELPAPKTTREKFDGRYDVVESGCWEWRGSLSQQGYGRLGDKDWAHRVSYELHIGHIPHGFEVDHLCRNRACVNPDHLEAVTPEENRRRARRTHCFRGHDYATVELYISPDGRRQCRECIRIREQKRVYR